MGTGDKCALRQCRTFVSGNRRHFPFLCVYCLLTWQLIDVHRLLREIQVVPGLFHHNRLGRHILRVREDSSKNLIRRLVECGRTILQHFASSSHIGSNITF